MAGRGQLDEDALLDLAEVRWRTGDLAGAGDAAHALIERGRGDAIALVIAAESTAAIGRPGEARRLAGLALEATDEPLDTLFAGMPRSAIWPGEPAAAGDGPVAGGPVVPGSPAAAPAAAAEAFAGGRAALAGGDADLAGLRFGVALRLEPAFAREVLGAVGEQPADPGLALVAGDALRLLGREAEARVAFDLARGVPPARSRVPRPGEGHARRRGRRSRRRRRGDAEDDD